MANETAVNQNKTKSDGERTGIRVKALRFSRPNGLELPVDMSGGDLRYKMVNHLTAGESGEGKTEIELQPWSRRYRVSRTLKDGRAFAYSIPDTWAMHVE
jgi:hypothetical protein